MFGLWFGLFWFGVCFGLVWGLFWFGVCFGLGFVLVWGLFWGGLGLLVGVAETTEWSYAAQFAHLIQIAGTRA